MANVFIAGLGIAFEQSFHRHDETRRAVSALGPSPIALRLLDRGHRPVLSDTLDGRDLGRVSFIVDRD